MRKTFHLFAFVILMASVVFPSLKAYASQDSNPELYLRGEENGWMCQDQYKFDCHNNVYTLHLNSLNGEFKISDSEWGVEYGAKPGTDPHIYGSIKMEGAYSGGNFTAHSLTDVTIEFTYNPSSNRYTTIAFSIGGEDPEEPVYEDMTSGTLPVLHINVYDDEGYLNNEIIDKDLSHKNYFSGVYWLDLNGCKWLEDLGAESVGSEEEPLPLEIKARGNWTRIGFSKKPFKLKLGKKQSLLGLSKSKHFAILAHADDFFGYMRNFTGFNLGKRIELPWTPWQQPVEVVINGDYRGLYFLTESIRVEEQRVNITELGDNVNDPSIVTGGYLVELDNYDEDNQIRMEEKGQAGGFKDMLRITFDTPEEYSDLQRMFVTDQFTAMNDAVGNNSDVLWSYMDLDDAARYYIVEEIISHYEAYHGSTYLFRDRGENQKWHFSPLWDCGNAFAGPTDNYFTEAGIYGNTWIASMRLNGKFMDKVRETWKWFMSQKYDGIEDDLNEYSEHIKAAAEADYRRWNNQPTPMNGTSVVDNRDMDSRLSDVKGKLRAKTEWMAREFGEYNNGYFAEPERDTTPAAELPYYVTTDINEIQSAVENDSDIEIYTLQGVRVSAPESGNIYIIRRNGKSMKVMAE